MEEFVEAVWGDGRVLLDTAASTRTSGCGRLNRYLVHPDTSLWRGLFHFDGGSLWRIGDII
jgi:hypothetical protein